jgi:hypothetical protein
MSLIKLCSVIIPDSHLKEDHEELEKMKKNSKGILKTVKEMEEEDSKAKK